MNSEAKITSILNVIGRIRGLGHDFIVQSLNEAGVRDIAPQHGDIIAALGSMGSMTMGALAAATKRKKNTLTTLVQSLERNGYIIKSQVEGDARVQQVSLTEKGNELYKVALQISYEMHDLMWAGFTPKEQQELMALLEKMVANML